MENKNYIWRPVSEYTGGRVLATNGLDVIIGEINSEGDCKSEEDGSTILCGITGFIKIEEMLPELKESERIRKAIIKHFEKERKESRKVNYYGVDVFDILAWLEKQGEQKPAWSEEDEKTAFYIRKIIEKYAFSQSAVDVNGELCEKEYIEADNWLKSLKERYTWKPSDEQMKALWNVYQGGKEQAALASLYSDLKRLLKI